MMGSRAEPRPRDPGLKSPHQYFCLHSVIKVGKLRPGGRSLPQTPNSSRPGIQALISGYRAASDMLQGDMDCDPVPKGQRIDWGREGYILKDHGELSFLRVPGTH